MILFTKNTALTGTVTIDAKDATATLYGTSTLFTPNTANLDLIVIANNNPSRMQVKEILNVDTNFILTLESNTKFFGDGYINIANGSNVITVTQNAYSVNLIANDIIVYEYLNNNVESKIISGGDRTYTLNTVSSTFTANANLTNYVVYPEYDNVSYQIIRTYYNDPIPQAGGGGGGGGGSEIIDLLGYYTTWSNPDGEVTVYWKFSPDGNTWHLDSDSTYIGSGDELEFYPWSRDEVYNTVPPSNDYWIRATYFSGDSPTGGNALDVWHKLSGAGSANVQFDWTGSAGDILGSITVEISSDSGGATILDSDVFIASISAS